MASPRLVRRTELGLLCVQGEPDCLEPAAALVLEAARAGRGLAEFSALGGHAVYGKGGFLRGKARLRHALRGAFLRRPLPRLREATNLAWLRRHGFGAPRPLAAGSLRRGGLPRYQFLFNGEIPGAPTLRELFEGDAAPEVRLAVLRALGREAARLHGLGFVHCDLFPRNLLVTGLGGEPRIHFLDAWRGGPPPQLRTAAYDLACLMVHGAALFAPAEERALFAAWLAGRERDGAPVEAGALLPRVARLRARLARRFNRRRAPASLLPCLLYTSPSPRDLSTSRMPSSA